MKYLCLLLTFLLASCVSSEKCECISLFDGKTLNGWEALPGGDWSVKDGMIVGFQKKAEKRHGMLISEKHIRTLKSHSNIKQSKGIVVFTFV